ncbi:hypothetical protein PVAND_007449 [Polypedilum vanderplanki]|uniref:Uncharacterized protein n=1 Tax=Polypedilum vanderplanki TaxID=319348 RepID=A0A9J6C707_POLVA|nr:hypothetical protein PVAND_007449 [Polypedilum vanderplanki]
MPKRMLGEKSKLSITETPSDVKIYEIISEESTPEKTVKKRTIKKRSGKKQELRSGKKQELVEIVTVQEENKQPETTVNVTEIETPLEEISDIMPKRMLGEKSKLSITEAPSDVKIYEIISEESTPEKRLVKKRTIKKRSGKKQELVEIVTVQEENKQPETTLQAIETDQIEKLKTKKTIEEIPSDVKISEIVTEESTPDKSIKKRVIKKKVGKKQEITENCTTDCRNPNKKNPQTTVHLSNEDSIFPVEGASRQLITEFQFAETQKLDKLIEEKYLQMSKIS